MRRFGRCGPRLSGSRFSAISTPACGFRVSRFPLSPFLGLAARRPARGASNMATNTPNTEMNGNTKPTVPTTTNGDLNNTLSARPPAPIIPDLPYLSRTRSLAIPASEDDSEVRKRYRPFLFEDEGVAERDWVAGLELATVMETAERGMREEGEGGGRLRVLVLVGSLRGRSYSRLLAFEASRILFRLGCDVRIYDPTGLPIKDDVQHDHPKVQELRSLSRWSDGHVWVSPEQHGNLTAVFKNQIDWIPLSTGSVRPTQGRILALAQVSGGSQSFNTVNSLRILGRWMRMFAIPNQSSVPNAYTQFSAEDEGEGGSRMLPSANRDRLVDCMEEFVKYGFVMRPHFEVFGDRFSERVERRAKVEKAEAEEREKARAKGGKETDVVNGVDVKGI